MLKRAGTLLLMACVILTILLLAGVYARTPPRYYFGDLATLPEHAQYEASHGVKVATLELSWDMYEPQDGRFDGVYVASLKSRLNILLRAGMRVTLALGLSYSPSWIFNYPNSRFVNENGTLAGQGCSSTNEVNLIFNQVLRQKAEAYFDRIISDLGVRNFWAIRLTSGGDCEMVYPNVHVHEQRGSYWAFDANAQNGPDMPPSMARNPFPGWKPGQRTYHGRPFTTSQVKQWADWYVTALDNVANWQVNKFNSLGFYGYYQTITPGSGERPDAYASDIDNYLPNSMIGFGGAWDKFYQFLPNKQRVVAYVSSMADGSGNNDSCQSTDDSVALTDPAADSWSATRWISRIADQYHLPKAGENPGYSDVPNRYYADMSSTGLMANSIRQMQSCGFQGLYWAHDDRLWDGTLPFSLYASYIAQINGGGVAPPSFPNVVFPFNVLVTGGVA